MGVPLPPHAFEEPAQQQPGAVAGPSASRRPAGGAQRRSRLEPGPGQLAAAADARLHSLSSLLAFTREVAATSQPLPPARPAAAAPPFAPPPPPPPLADANGPPNSPPPLAEESDSGSDWGDDFLPPLVPDSPRASQQPTLDDICPWGLIDEEDDEEDEDAIMQDVQPLRPRRDGLRQPSVLRALPRMFGGSSGGGGSARWPPGSASDSLLGAVPRLHFTRAGFGLLRASPAQPAPASSTQPLEAELAGMAARLAELVRQHQGSAHPGVLTGLQDAANLLQGLASGAGQPPSA